MKLLAVLILSSAAALLLCRPSTAAVISHDWKSPGDGLLTYDTVNKREWLDLTESRLAMFSGATLEQRYQNSIVQIGPDGPYQGFQVAIASDLLEFSQSAGINIATRDDFVGNESPTRILIELLGSSLAFQNGRIVTAFGLLDELATVGSSQIRKNGVLWVDPDSGGTGQAGVLIGPGVFSDGISSGNTGVWLFRNVPEPNGMALGVMGAILSTLVFRS